MSDFDNLADRAARDRITEARLRALDMCDIVEEVHALEDKIERLTSRGFEDLHFENEQLKAKLESYEEAVHLLASTGVALNAAEAKLDKAEKRVTQIAVTRDRWRERCIERGQELGGLEAKLDDVGTLPDKWEKDASKLPLFSENKDIRAAFLTCRHQLREKLK